MGYYWPSLFKDAKEYINICDCCQSMGKHVPSYEMPLQPQVLIKHFEKWDLDFFRPINPPSRKNRYISVCIDCVTKWTEAKALSFSTENFVVSFIF